MDSVDSAGANKRAKSDGSPMETLVGKLLHGMRHRKKDGYLRKEANRATKGKKGLNDEDKSMLFAQGLLLEVHLKSTGGTQHSSRNSSSQKFQSDGRVTIRELCRAWGKGKKGLRDIQNESRKNAIAMSLLERWVTKTCTLELGSTSTKRPRGWSPQLVILLINR